MMLFDFDCLRTYIRWLLLGQEGGNSGDNGGACEGTIFLLWARTCTPEALNEDLADFGLLMDCKTKCPTCNFCGTHICRLHILNAGQSF